jgi:uncharacterized tellurite resistance protein B-like protein
MSILKKIFGSSSSPKKYIPESEQEAWIAIMYACMHIDGHISDSEIHTMFHLLEKQPLFKRKHVADYYQPAMLGHRKVGDYALIDFSVPLIQEDHKVIIFGLIMQLLLADGVLSDTEKDIAEYLTKAMHLDMKVAKQIVDELLVQG